MSVLTARVAGVDRVVSMSAPGGEFGVHVPTIYAMRLAGADEIYALGGVQVTPEPRATFEAQRTDISTPVVTAEIQNLPLNTRNTLNLAAIVPGVFDLAWNTAQFSNVFVLGVPAQAAAEAAAAAPAAPDPRSPPRSTGSSVTPGCVASSPGS